MHRILICIYLLLITGAAHGQDSLQKVIVLPDTAVSVQEDIHYNLLVAAYNGDDSEVLRLLKEGAYIDYRSEEGITPLMYAVENGHVQVVKILILNGADPNLKDYSGRPPLISAARYADIEIAELLIREGADVNSTDSDDRTALMYAAYYGYTVFADLLIYYDAEINLVDDDGSTALNIAALQGHAELVKLLIDQGASLEKADNTHSVPMHSAARRGSVEILKELKEAGASVDIRNKGGQTPLTLAIRNDRKDAVKYLLDAGADPNVRVASGVSPLILAKLYASDEVTDLLIEKGARLNVWPAFHYTSINFDFNASANDFFFGGGLGMQDTKYHLVVNAGFDTRIFAKAILVEQSPNVYNQYWEKRSLWYVNLQKQFDVFDFGPSRTGGFFIGGQVTYSTAKYRGVTGKPEAGFYISPLAGMYYRKGLVMYTLNYEYLNFDLNKVSPNRFKFGICFLIRDQYLKSSSKQIPWPEN